MSYITAAILEVVRRPPDGATFEEIVGILYLEMPQDGVASATPGSVRRAVQYSLSKLRRERTLAKIGQRYFFDGQQHLPEEYFER